jgi:hypothetical protein
MPPNIDHDLAGVYRLLKLAQTLRDAAPLQDAEDEERAPNRGALRSGARHLLSHSIYVLRETPGEDGFIPEPDGSAAPSRHSQLRSRRVKWGRRRRIHAAPGIEKPIDLLVGVPLEGATI